MTNHKDQLAEGISIAFSDLLVQSLKAFEAASAQSGQVAQTFAKALEDGQEEGRQVVESFAMYVTRRNEALAELVSGLSGTSEFHTNGRTHDKPMNDSVAKLIEQDAGLVRELSRHLETIQERQVALAKNLLMPAVKMVESGQALTQSLAKYNAALLDAYQRSANEVVAWLTGLAKSGAQYQPQGLAQGAASRPLM